MILWFMLEAQLSIVIGKSLNLHFDKFTTAFEKLFIPPILTLNPQHFQSTFLIPWIQAISAIFQLTVLIWLPMIFDIIDAILNLTNLYCQYQKFTFLSIRNSILRWRRPVLFGESLAERSCIVETYHLRNLLYGVTLRG